MKCTKCGQNLKSSFKLCPNCGEEVKIIKKPKKKNRKLYTGIIIGVVLVGIIMSIVFILMNRKIDIEEVKNSVVQIYVYDEDDEIIATGSGVIAFEDDLVLTNAHVVEDNNKLEVISENNTKYTVEGILAYNKKKDIAILKLNKNNGGKALKIKEKVSVGDEVIAIGSPLGLKNTVSSGMLSGYFQDNIEVYQHTAPISSGSSGGALLNNKGKLIGITYASINGGQNLNLAIPISEYKNEYKKIKDNKPIETKSYYLLNNSILKTNKGNTLLDYALNDEYGNHKWKSGVVDEIKEEEGYLYFCNSLGNCNYVNELEYKKISDYVGSSFYIVSGWRSIYEVSLDGEFNFRSGKGYEIIVMKLNDSSPNAINKVKKFMIAEADKFKISSDNKYVYGLSCIDYDECNKVENLLNEFIK